MKRLFVALSLCWTAAWAQNISCSLSGTVQDGQGAVFPSLEIRVAATDTGIVRTTKTNQEGFFSLPDLIPGSYELKIGASGFKSYSQSGIDLSSGEQRQLGVIRLEVGNISDSVTVTAAANPVALGSGERAATLTTEDISSMALKGRDFMDAVALLPGVVDTSDTRDAPRPDSMSSIYIAGGRQNQKNMTIDGVTNMDTGNNTTVHTMPSMDSVAEVKVLMSNYSAEYGRNSGGTITVITRGGGKDFHGSAGWYHRHEDLSANNYFNNQNGIPRAPYRYNTFSYTFGGPVYVPGKFNNDRTKLFFFISQEFQSQLVSYGSKTVRVPTALERAGDFSQSYDVNGKVIPVYDPLNGQKQFPGNVVPASRFNPVGQAILKMFPMPNFVDPNPSRVYQWNYISQDSGPYPRRTDVFRADYSPKQNMQAYVRLSNTSDEQNLSYGAWVAGSMNFPLTPVTWGRPGRGATAHVTNTISPTLFNEFIFGVSNNQVTIDPVYPQNVSRSGTGVNIPQWWPQNNPLNLIPNMSFSSVPNYANPSMHAGVPYFNSNTIFSLVENVSKVVGTHTLKAGLYLEKTRKNTYSNALVRGKISFDRDRNSPLDTNYAWTNALIGDYTSYTEADRRPVSQLRFTNLEWYVQDNWRVRRGLTLDFGLRMNHDMPAHEKQSQVAAFIPSLYNAANAPVLLRPGYDAAKNKVAIDPLTGAMYPQTLIGTYVPGMGNPANGMAITGQGMLPNGLYTVPALTFAPRVGFSWDPFGKARTAVRGGVGIFYDTVDALAANILTNPPVVLQPTVYYGTLQSLASTSGQGLLAPSSITTLFGNQRTPRAYNFSFGIQQQINSATVVDVSYVGALGRHLIWQREINPVPIGADFLKANADPTATNKPLAANFLRPYQGYDSITLDEFGATSSYNSLQVSLSRRMSRGIMFGMAYTFGKALGTSSADGDNVSAFFSPRQWNYGPLSYNRTHVLSFRYTWTLPKPGQRLGLRPLAIVADNWQLSGITRLMSGAPFTPGYSLVNGADITGTPSEGARVNVLDPSSPALTRFGPPAVGTFGNAGTNVLYGPGVNNWDMSLYRAIRIKERLTAQLRAETYNTFNHTQFSALNTTARFDATGAQIDPLFLTPKTARSPRRIQLALRINF